MAPFTSSLALLSAGEVGPNAARSLKGRGSPLASPAAQVELLESLPLEADFEAALRQAKQAPLRPSRLEVLQINLGRLCNMACRHCHVDAGPDRLEQMDRATVDFCLFALDRTTAHTVDITGGAPELNPHFRTLVEQCVVRGKHVIDRCNLTVLLLPRFADLPQWLGEHGVELICSLPHPRRPGTDAQRGDGAFEKSVEALRRLNQAGYGKGNGRRRLTLMMNPVGAFLPGGQASLEREWKAALLRRHGITFDRLLALNNMPVGRFLEWLVETQNLEEYLAHLVSAFNGSAVPGLMCRSSLSVAHDGTLYDCDFNQMLELPIGGPSGHVRALDPKELASRAVRVGRHCFGCTAGAGSSCGGSTV
ncbi:MAG: arsenosugar biosynthesis radical SAM protein ArsS [Myxococcales bacterium]|nr:arsenosugar biosynthesis radical SAM protein ArsS [Myxococcales bacterium]